MPITIYGIKNCDTMKKARAWLDKRGVDYAFHDYKSAGIERAQAGRLGEEGRLGDAAQPRRHDIQETARQGQSRRHRKEGASRLMLKQPSMIKRPVLELGGGRLLVGFKPEQYGDAFALRH